MSQQQHQQAVASSASNQPAVTSQPTVAALTSQTDHSSVVTSSQVASNTQPALPKYAVRLLKEIGNTVHFCAVKNSIIQQNDDICSAQVLVQVAA